MEKLKWVCEYSCDGTNLSFEKDRAYGFSWPQRNYRCSFCKKEFKSAQALGGHMNVHRRDRARLRLSPNSNPNPNPSFPPTSAKLFPYNAPPFAAHVIDSPSLQQADAAPAAAAVDLGKKKMNEGGMLELGKRKEARVWKANELIRLDLNLGLIQDAKEDLDLELRLGYNS